MAPEVKIMSVLVFFLCILLLTGCAGPEPLETAAAAESVAATIPATIPTQPPTEATETTVPPDPVQELLDQMSIEERVGQLFLARCDDASALQDIPDYHLGGYVLFGVDFEEETPDSLREKLASYQNAAKIPLLIAVDEEGGTVTRVSRYSAFRESNFPSPRNAFAAGGLEGALAVEEEKCRLLSSLGINVNLAPVCDITTNPAAFMYQRSLGQSPEVTARFISETVSVMQEYQIGSALKHFPGYGNNTDTHTGIAVDSRSLAELEEVDLCPFRGGIAAGCGAILVSHTIVEALDAELPASLSPAVHRYLRQNMGFSGVILTDDLVMQAITDLYGAGEAAVMAVQAGNDLLCSTDYRTQYDAVLAAVMDGRIDFDTLNNAVRNVLEWKAELGSI